MSNSEKIKKNTNNRESKKAAVMGSRKKNRLPMIITLAVLVLAGGSIIGFMQYNKTGPALVTGTAKAPQSTDASAVTYPITLFDDGQARHYSFKAGNETIRYFVLKSADGVVRAAFDACDVCWPAGKGYFQEGDNMVCRNCGRRFASSRINEVKGGCNPAPLNRSVQGEQLVIKIDDILEGKSYFNFSGRG
jgi:uncharacterized membrane protein